MTSDTKHRETGEALRLKIRPEAFGPRYFIEREDRSGDEAAIAITCSHHKRNAELIVAALHAYPDLVAQNAKLKAALAHAKVCIPAYFTSLHAEINAALASGATS